MSSIVSVALTPHTHTHLHTYIFTYTHAQQVYELFNKVLILSQGETIYFGGTKAILDW